MLYLFHFAGAPLGSLGEPEKGSAGRAASGFVASKWETVDPEEVKKGVVTTSKWETEEKEELVKARKALMGSVASKWDDREDDIDGVPMGADSDSGEVSCAFYDCFQFQEKLHRLRNLIRGKMRREGHCYARWKCV